MLLYLHRPSQELGPYEERHQKEYPVARHRAELARLLSLVRHVYRRLLREKPDREAPPQLVWVVYQAPAQVLEAVETVPPPQAPRERREGKRVPDDPVWVVPSFEADRVHENESRNGIVEAFAVTSCEETNMAQAIPK